MVPTPTGIAAAGPGLVCGAHGGHVCREDGSDEFDCRDNDHAAEYVGEVGVVGQLVQDNEAEGGHEDRAAAEGHYGDHS